MSKTQRWVFTANNPPADWEEKARTLSDKIVYAFVGREVAPTTGTPHLQGYFEFSGRKMLPGAKKLMKLCGLEGAHLEPAKGNLEQIQTYNGKTDQNPLTWGTPIPTQGTRTDLQRMRDAAVKGASSLQLGEDFTAQHARYHSWVEDQRELARTERETKRRRIEAESVTLRTWQKNVWRALEEQSKRKVLWCWENKGGVGKSMLADWIRSMHGAFISVGGKYADIALSYNCEEYVVFDLSREQHERVPYGLLEGFKNGRVFSGKYASKLKEFKPAKVIVFANFMPELEKMSADRWDIHHVAGF